MVKRVERAPAYDDAPVIIRNAVALYTQASRPRDRARAAVATAMVAHDAAIADQYRAQVMARELARRRRSSSAAA
jgi:hypothetical protein